MLKITYERDGALAVVTLNDPPINLFELEMATDFKAILDHVEKYATRGMILKND